MGDYALLRRQQYLKSRKRHVQTSNTNVMRHQRQQRLSFTDNSNTKSPANTRDIGEKQRRSGDKSATDEDIYDFHESDSEGEGGTKKRPKQLPVQIAKQEITKPTEQQQQHQLQSPKQQQQNTLSPPPQPQPLTPINRKRRLLDLCVNEVETPSNVEIHCDTLALTAKDIKEVTDRHFSRVSSSDSIDVQSEPNNLQEKKENGGEGEG
jgi:hypothetical protein